MRFTVEPTYLLDPLRRYAVVTDADTTVAYCEWRSWAEHIANLLTADERDFEPTPDEQDLERARDQGIRQAKDAEEFGTPPLHPAAEDNFRLNVKRYMEGEQNVESEQVVTFLEPVDVSRIDGWRCPHCKRKLLLAEVEDHVLNAHDPVCESCRLELLVVSAVQREQQSHER